MINTKKQEICCTGPTPLSDNVIGYGSDQDDWYTLGQLKRSIGVLARLDMSKKEHQEALRREKNVFKRYLEKIVSLGRDQED